MNQTEQEKLLEGLLNLEKNAIAYHAPTAIPVGACRLWFMFRNRELLVMPRQSGGYYIPYLGMDENAPDEAIRILNIGALGNAECYAAELPENFAPPEGYEFLNLRQAFSGLTDVLAALAGRAIQLLEWDRDHIWCGRCGNQTEIKPYEWARKCPVCSLTVFPRIAPAVIVAVRREKEILLTRSYHFRPGIYSVQAGFVEAGESLEETVRRELMEETGIQVKNIRYFGSQSWPFPNSLMVGFMADYAGGEINLDPKEVEDGGWYHYDALPNVPDQVSIARRLIDEFIRSCQ